MTRDYGQEMSFFDVTETRARVNTKRYFQSSYDPTAFHMHPLRYALMIAKKAEAAGARHYENSPAVSVEKQGALWSVRTAQGEARAANVVYCVSSLDRTLHQPYAYHTEFNSNDTLAAVDDSPRIFCLRARSASTFARFAVRRPFCSGLTHGLLQ